VPQNRSPVSKAIPIINPLTKTTLSFDPNAPVLPPPPDVTDEKIEFKVPDTASRAVSIVNPASKGDKELESAENRKAIEEKESKQLEHDEEQKKKEEERLKKEEEEKQKEIEREKIIRRIEEDELKRIEEAKKKEEQIVAQKVGMVPPIDTFTRPLTESPVSTPLEKTKATQASTIRKIDDPSVIEYPPNISSFPTTSIKETGRFIYSPEFLRQFQALCNETSQDLSAIEAANSIMDETSMQRKQSMDRTNSRGPTTPTGSLLNSPLVPNSGGDPMFRMNSREGGNRMEMGKFNMGRPLIPRTPSGSIEHHHPFSTPMQKSANLSGRGRGGMKIFRNPTQNIQGGPTIPLEQVAPLEKSENRWVPHAKETPQEESELIPQATIIRKVNALLNKITLEKFDSIAEQIFHYAHQSAKEKDGKTLRTVIKLLFNKACDEPAFAGMWGQLCRYLFSHMKDDIQDVNLVENDKPVSGSILFRKYLFNRCQKEFERGWKVNMPKMENAETLMTDEYYAAAKAKRQGLGLIQFVGEMYKLQMLSYSVMKSCITKLAEGAETACDEEVESLCKFITTVGKVLDKKEDTKSAVDHSIHLMTNVIPKSPNITNRVKFMMLVEYKPPPYINLETCTHTFFFRMSLTCVKINGSLETTKQLALLPLQRSMKWQKRPRKKRSRQ
jgi:translation initiation factor 4G